eukprot:gene52005-69584_t
MFTSSPRALPRGTGCKNGASQLVVPHQRPTRHRPRHRRSRIPMPSEMLTSREDQALVLTLSDPATRNTLSPQAYAAGIEALTTAQVVALTSAQAAALTSAQAAAMETADVAALETADLRSLTTAALR